jgi:hypothetical protein
VSKFAQAFALRRQGLTPIEKLVLRTLVDAVSPEGSCRVPFFDLHELTEPNDCDLTKALAGLESLGLIAPHTAADWSVFRIACDRDE